MNRLNISDVQVIAALVEGASINSTCRMTGVAKHTVLKLLKDMGCACAAYHNRAVRNLRVRRIQADEIWALMYGKDKNARVLPILFGRTSTLEKMGALHLPKKRLTNVRNDSNCTTIWNCANFVLDPGGC
jgi:hypothetical protein